MSNLRRQAVRELGLLFDEQLKLNQPTTLVAAPPSQVADYATVSIQLERFHTEYGEEDELGLNSDGELAVGAVREWDDIVAPASVGSGKRLSRIGTLTGQGRIWVGSRYPAKREEVEGQIFNLFNQDMIASGRILAQVREPVVDGIRLPWPWNVAFFTGDSQWTDEFAFSERLFSWISFEYETDLLILRGSPLMERVIVGLHATLKSTADLDPASTFTDPNTEHYLIARDGSVTPFTLP